jgi:apolipoprotein N-acyltransferase
MLNAPGLPPFGPLVCYEAIFSNAALPNSGLRPSFLLNVTNDGWFGITPGPSQHFALSRLRAIEEGLPLVRAANNGISAVIDPYGRVEAKLALGERGVLDVDLPLAIDPPLFNHLPYFAWILMLMAISLEVGLKMTQRQLTRNLN